MRHLHARHSGIKGIKAQECRVYERRKSVSKEIPENTREIAGKTGKGQAQASSLAQEKDHAQEDRGKKSKGNGEVQDRDSGIGIKEDPDKTDDMETEDSASGKEKNDEGTKQLQGKFDADRMAERIRQLEGKLAAVTEERDGLLGTVDKLKTALKLKAKLASTGTKETAASSEAPEADPGTNPDTNPDTNPGKRGKQMSPALSQLLMKKGGSYYCKGCKEPRAYTSYSGFTQHAQDKHIFAGVKYKCPAQSCDRIEKSLSALRVHLSRKHKGYKGAKPADCRVQTNSPSKLNAYSEDNYAKSADGGYYCKLCDHSKSYKSTSGLFTHIQSKHVKKAKDIKSTAVPKVEGVSEDLGRHFLAEFAEGGVTPGEEHEPQVVGGTSKPIGSQTGKKGGNQSDSFLKMFMKTRVERVGSGFRCMMCKKGTVYTSQNGIRNHAMDKHIWEGATFRCPIPSCNKVVRNQNTLRVHVSKKHPEYRKGTRPDECRVLNIKQERLDD